MKTNLKKVISSFIGRILSFLNNDSVCESYLCSEIILIADFCLTASKLRFEAEAALQI
jgi:hypothetical protein